MSKSLFLVLIFTIIQISIKAQLNGTKTIGGSGADYATITAAESALYSAGVNGPVVFNIASGTYNEQITIRNITGASAINTITFKSAANDSSLVVIQNASATSSTNNFLIRFQGASFITLKGITLQRTGTNNYSTVVDYIGITSNIKIMHCVIKNNASSAANYASLVYATGGSNNHSHLCFNNNSFINGSYGIYFFGQNQSSLSSSNVIINNVFSNQQRGAINVYYQNAPIIKDNIINSSSTYYLYTGIYGQYCNNGIEIRRNKLTLNKGSGLQFNNCSGQIQAGLIVNNFISMSGSGATAIKYSNSGKHNIYYNSIYITGSGSKGFFITGSQSQNLRFKNNIISAANSAQCWKVESSANFPLTTSDYNDFYFVGGANLGRWHNTSNIASLAAWRSASNKEAHSINVNPNFTSTTNLHINAPSAIGKQGSAALTTPSTNLDIDGNLRNISTPDIGAHEFTFSDYEVLNVILSKTSYCTGESDIIKAYVKNNSNHSYSGTINMQYIVGSAAAVTQNMTITNLGIGDSTLVSFSNNNSFNSATTTLSIKVKILSSDMNNTNNSKTTSVAVSQTPSTGWTTDSLACAGRTITLDAGAGMTSYLWSTGATSQTIQVDSTGIGFGTKYFKVAIEKNGCNASDSILVNFIYCGSVNAIADDASIIIYPNPSSGVIYINSNNINLSNSKLKVYSSIGKKVYSSIYQKPKIELPQLTKGIYYLKIETKTGVLVKPIIIK